jgi:hypothetical protein
LAGLSFYPLIIRFNRWLIKKKARHGFTPGQLSEIPFRVACGHFCANAVIEAVPGALTTLVLRDPLERVISHYHHWKKNKGHGWFRLSAPYRHFRNIQEGFRYFAFHEDMQNYQTGALGGMSVSDFDLVGTTEQMGRFFEGFLALIDFHGSGRRITIPRLNRASQKSTRQELGIDRAFEERFRKFHCLDYQNYDAAQRR